MAKEMADGRRAVQQNATARETLQVNAGGPYGSAVLRGVQADSERVWESVLEGSAGAGQSWFKATISITGDDSSPWTVTAKGQPTPAHEFAAR